MLGIDEPYFYIQFTPFHPNNSNESICLIWGVVLAAHEALGLGHNYTFQKPVHVLPCSREYSFPAVNNK